MKSRKKFPLRWSTMAFRMVMMASPKDSEYFALGFSAFRGIIESPRDIFGMDVVPSCNGLEVQIELSSRHMGLKERRRALAGRTGCGVCGVEQLNDIGKPVQPLPFTQTFDLNKTGCCITSSQRFSASGATDWLYHAAARMLPSGELVGGHEDVGRHVCAGQTVRPPVTRRGKLAARCGTGFQSCQL